MSYAISECFYSLQGEGARAGTANVFLRFAGCNLKCRKDTHGFDCDTDLWGDGIQRSVAEVVAMVEEAAPAALCEWIVLTGGEPTLQLDQPLISALIGKGYSLAIETNGTRDVPMGVDWIAVSPKRGEALEQRVADEVRYVVAEGDPLPRCEIIADHYFLSPAAAGATIAQSTLRHCVGLCLENPKWRLSMQQHKIWGVR